MKTILIALNASYTHTNLAVRYLSAAAGCPFYESNINRQEDVLLQEILQFDADVYCFSCYIWNISLVLQLADSIKQLRPQAVVALGGPEVSFNAHHLLERNPAVDYILCGEGEQLFPRFLEALAEDRFVPGMLGRGGGDDRYQVVEDLDSLPFPYAILPEKQIIYYEMSRGCPFGCTYCLSGRATGSRVRRLSVERVKADLLRLAQANVKVIKLVDRTFNANLPFAKEILRFILDHTGAVRFHFEIGADLLDQELLELLASAPPGKFQLEAGVQSCNPKTLELVKRQTDFARLQHNVRSILQAGNIHLHLDLIAGLPREDLASFAQSFDRVFTLRPHLLQLGFLKLLPGSELREQARDHGILYRNQPPYEVLRTNVLSEEDLFLLKGIEELVERYYNAGHCPLALEYLLSHFDSPFELFRELLHFVGSGVRRPASLAGQLDALAVFARQHCDDWVRFLCYLKLDYYQSGAKGNIPTCFAAIAQPFDGKALRKQLALPKEAKIDLFPMQPALNQAGSFLLVVHPGRARPRVEWMEIGKTNKILHSTYCDHGEYLI